jgi:hypothetical protein
MTGIKEEGGQVTCLRKTRLNRQGKEEVSCLVIFSNFVAEKLGNLVCSYFPVWCTLFMYLCLHSPEWRSQLQGRRGDHIYVELIIFQDCLLYCTYTRTYSIYLDGDYYRRHMAFFIISFYMYNIAQTNCTIFISTTYSFLKM